MSDAAWPGRNYSFLLDISNIVSTLAVALSMVEFCKARDPITYYAKSWRSRMKSWRLPYHIICFQDELSRFSDTFTSRRQLNQIFFLVFSPIFIYIYQAHNHKGCLTAPLSVTGGKSFGILYYWVYIKKFNDGWWITSVPAMRLQKWMISLNREFLLICV